MHPIEVPGRLALVIMGVSGSGKTSVGSALAQRLGIAFVDGDALHPAANVAKMSRGEALSDEDRRPWLDRVGAVLADHQAHPQGVIVACSALRRIYRDRIRAEAAETGFRFVFLDISVAVSQARLLGRKGHFMPVSLVRSQFDTLERPGTDEPDVITVEETHGVDETVSEVLGALRREGVAA